MALQKADEYSVIYIILESVTDGTLPVHGTVILKVAHYRTGKLMAIQFFMIYTKYEIMISHAAALN